jgi:(p)ppGpp synthase/HD superfamily hydrolase
MNSLNHDQYINSFEFESRIRNSNYAEKSHHANNLWDKLISGLDQRDIEFAVEARKFAATINYRHPGLEPAEYFLHPLRVGSLGGLINSENKLISVQVGLLHNIYEVTDLDRSQIVDLFGLTVDSVLSKLTIDRKRQPDTGYLGNYYDEITALPQNLGLIKVLDKIDNLYLLNVTASPSIKEKYLQEVDGYLRPLCEKVAPYLSNTLNKIIERVRY